MLRNRKPIRSTLVLGMAFVVFGAIVQLATPIPASGQDCKATSYPTQNPYWSPPRPASCAPNSGICARFFRQTELLPFCVPAESGFTECSDETVYVPVDEWSCDAFGNCDTKVATTYPVVGEVASGEICGGD